MAARGRSKLGLTGNIAILSLLAFGGVDSSHGELLDELETLTYDELSPFSSDEEFLDWAHDMHEVRRAHIAGGCGGLVVGCAAEAPMNGDASMPADESITNVQEEGVDEGGIVKAAGEYFVILRRGRIFTVRQETAGENDLVAVDQIDAYPEGWTRGTWYDELLVHSNRVIVVGYSYQVGATELSFFELGRDGSLTHEATHFLRSNDYYSSRNYASRLVDGSLVFYIPYRLFERSFWGKEELGVPSMKTWEGKNNTSPWEPIVAKDEIFRPIQGDLYPTLHTVVHCDLDAAELDCTGRAVVGPRARTFYVTREHIWLWVAPSHLYAREPSEPHPPSYLYRLPLGEGDVGAIQAHGAPIDQFSFLESDDGHINVVLLPQGGGDEMWQPELVEGGLALLRVPLSMVSRTAPKAERDDYTVLPAPEGYGLRNRFVGEHVLWGSGSSWDITDSRKRVFAAPYASPDDVHEVALDHVVERIEVLGDGAMVVGSSNEGLVFSSVNLDDEPAVSSTYLREDATQGETRSHGFFFRRDAAGGGLLGLPLRYEGHEWSHLRYGSAEVRFLSVDTELSLSSIGGLAASEEAQVDDDCAYSCVDWYGNARPIFYRGRIFALMGYELVEGQIDDAGLYEIRRLDFLQEP